MSDLTAASYSLQRGLIEPARPICHNPLTGRGLKCDGGHLHSPCFQVTYHRVSKLHDGTAWRSLSGPLPHDSPSTPARCLSRNVIDLALANSPATRMAACCFFWRGDLPNDRVGAVRSMMGRPPLPPLLLRNKLTLCRRGQVVEGGFPSALHASVCAGSLDSSW